MKQKKQYFSNLESNSALVEIPDGDCVVSDRISVDGCKIGLMYRDFPISNTSDSGWVFLAGDEDGEYMNTPGNHSVFPLRLLCSYDADIIPFLVSDYETAFVRNTDGNFEFCEHFFEEED